MRRARLSCDCQEYHLYDWTAHRQEVLGALSWQIRIPSGELSTGDGMSSDTKITVTGEDVLEVETEVGR